MAFINIFDLAERPSLLKCRSILKNNFLSKNGKVYAKVIPNTRGKTLNRINHSRLFADKHNHINGIENFWNQAKRHMRKFNGVPKDQFPLFVEGLRMAI